MGRGDADWPSIRREYEEGPLTVREIAARHGAGESTIQKQAKAEGWLRRRDRSRQGRRTRKSLPARLREAVTARLEELESVDTAAGRGAAERERDTRSLATLVKLSEKIVGLERKAREKASGPVEWTQEYRDRKR